MVVFIGQEVLDKIFLKEGYCKPFCFCMIVRVVRDTLPVMTLHKQLTY